MWNSFAVIITGPRSIWINGPNKKKASDLAVGLISRAIARAATKIASSTLRSLVGFFMWPNELVNWRRSPAGAQGTNSGHKNAEGMAAVGVHVELTVRLGRGVECVTSTHILNILGVALHVSICVAAQPGFLFGKCA